MAELLSYSPSDFLLFSQRVYIRLFELRNAALWPAPIIALALGGALVYLTAIRQSRVLLRLSLAILGIVWLWLSWSFFWTDYARINWTSRYIAPFAALEGCLLIGLATLVRTSSATRSNNPQRPNGRSWGSIGLAGFAVIGYPLIAAIMGRPWHAAEIVAIAPDPTAVITLALLSLIRERSLWLLMVVPVVWCAFTGLTLWVMQAGEFLVAPVCALAGIIFALQRR